MIKKKISYLIAASALACVASNTSIVGAEELTNESPIENNLETTNEKATSRIAATGQVINCPEGLNLRRGPNSKEILRLIPNGTILKINGISNGWYAVNYNGIDGYVSATYIKELNTSTTTSNDTAYNATGKVYRTDNEGLSLRQGPSTSTTRLALLPEGANITIVAKNGDWYKTSYAGKTGYVHSYYVQVQSSSTNSGTTSSDVTYNATGKVSNTDNQGLSLRQGPSTSTTRLALLPEGTSVTIVAKNGNWYKTSYAGKTGYIHSSYVTINSSTNSGTTSSDVTYNVNGKVSNTDNEGLSLRQGPSTSTTRLALLPEGTSVTIVAKNGNWYKTSYAGKTGYVHSSYVTIQTNNNNSNSGTTSSDVAYSASGKVYRTDYEGLSLRQSPSTSSSRLALLPEGTNITIVAKNGDWYKTSYAGKTGYVHSYYVQIGGSQENTTPSTPSTPSTQSKYEVVLNAMKAQLGSPYVWGGSGEYITYDSIANLKRRFPAEAAAGDYDYIPASFYNSGYRAFDCSGLMQWGFAQAGISIGRTTYSQVYNGVGVSVNNAQPGDLLLYSDLSHVGMYLGNGKWIESPMPGMYIRISDVPWSKIGYARRVL